MRSGDLFATPKGPAARAWRWARLLVEAQGASGCAVVEGCTGGCGGGGGALLGGIVGLVVMLADRAFEASEQFVGLSMLGGIGVGALTLGVIFFLMAAASEVADEERAATE